MLRAKVEIQAYLIDVIDFASFFRPVPMAHGDSVLHKSAQHYNDNTSLFPDHLQEIKKGYFKVSINKLIKILTSLKNRF